MLTPYEISAIAHVAVAFVMHQKVHLLLDDITVVAAECDERCLGGPRMPRTQFRFSELHNSHFLHRNNCVVLKNRIMKKQTWAEDQKLKISLEWPKQKRVTRYLSQQQTPHIMQKQTCISAVSIMKHYFKHLCKPDASRKH